MENNVLKIVLWGMTVGRLYWNKEHRRSYFTYDRDFLTKGLDIAPLTASINSPLSQRGLPHAGNTDKLYAGLPEFIASYASANPSRPLGFYWQKKYGRFGI